MKKNIFLVLSTCLFLVGCAARADMVSRIFVVNKTGEVLTRGPVVQQKGQKYAAKVKKKWKVKEVPKGFSCVGRTCTEKKRRVFWETKPKMVIAKKKVIQPGKVVEIATIDRNQGFVGRKKLKKLPGGFKNPDTKKFKTIQGDEWNSWGYKVFPFEDITTSLEGPKGRIGLVTSSERVGLDAKAYAASIGAGGVGAVGANLAVAGAGLTAVGIGAAAGAVGAAGGVTTSGGGIATGGAAIAFGAFLGAGGVAVVAVPVVIVSTAVIATLATLGTVAALVGFDQKSGLTVLPFMKKDSPYEVSYSTNPPGKKRRTGGLVYPDVYITIKLKK